MYPITNNTAQTNIIGAQWLAASLMGLKDLNVEYKDRDIEFQLSVRDSRRTFSNTVVGCLSLAQSVFHGNGSQVIVGAGFNPVTEAMAYVFSDPQNDLAQIAYASNKSSLSHNDVFPDFLRTYPSSSYEGYALAQTIKRHFGYTRVTLIHTSGLYGTDGAAEFITAAADLGIEIVSRYSFDPTETDFSSLQDSAEFDIRVYVLFMGTLKAAGNIMLYMTDSGLINDKTVTFGTSSMANSELWTSVTEDPVMVNRMMSRFFVISDADDDWKVTDRGKEFIRRFRALPNTSGDINGTTGLRTVCDKSKDSDGGYDLYQASLTGSAPFNCIGFNFSEFQTDGFDIASYTANAHDATWAAGVGVVKYADTTFQGVIPFRIQGTLLKASIIADVAFEGYSGNIGFSSGRPGRLQYGIGDRERGVRFKINNFHPGIGSDPPTLRRIGTWSEAGLGFKLCGNDSTLQSRVTGGCFSIIYSTKDNIQPLDRPMVLIQGMTASNKIGLYVMAAINLAVVVFFMVILVVYKKTRLLKASQPNMMWIIITANLFNVARTITSTYQVSVTTCTLSIWFGHLAFIAVIAMFAKTLRIFIIIKSGLRRIKITARNVLLFTACFYMGWILYLMFFSIFALPTILTQITTALNGQATVIRSCQAPVPGVAVALYVVEGIFLLASAVLCYVTRAVPDAINEAQVIAISLTIYVAVCVIGFPLTFAGGLDHRDQELVIGVCFFVAGIGSTVFYFGTKAYLLLTGADLNAQFKIVRKNAEKVKTADELLKMKDEGTLAALSCDKGLEDSEVAVILPKRVNETEKYILTLQGHLLTLLDKEARKLNREDGSSGGSQNKSSQSNNPSGKDSRTLDRKKAASEMYRGSVDYSPAHSGAGSKSYTETLINRNTLGASGKGAKSEKSNLSKVHVTAEEKSI
eukprot:CAMPEP_0119034848 /NCGR_PEP_ID=MMETSP1177-20130426/1866_1 /TAXON_ID=2985 /ORGANISM="Ochromonas sp, Strain CCMP1899" /LENGTH=916 /DNA_ID=CAMNT_0006992625 /DNA_START=611 /DNA_END=3364 /DNA_ORIENTATION=+